MTFDLQHWASEEFVFDSEYIYPEPDTFKPHGFWVSAGSEWPDWCSDVGFDKHGGLSVGYSVELNLEDVLVINTEEALLGFSEKFETIPEYMIGFSKTNLRQYIDWKTVQNRWKGILIIPYQWKQRFDLMWYYSWDVASGCIWDLSAVKSIRLFQPTSQK